ncbi:hypothetical protein NU219Hw_g5288t1 [Hortaea werneckii]
MPPGKQSKRQVNDGGELQGPGSKRSKLDAPHTEESVEVEGPDHCSTAVGETQVAPQGKKAGEPTAVVPSGERQKKVQEKYESRDSESAAGMGESMEKIRDHQTGRKRRSRQKFNREDFLKDQYDKFGTPLVEIRRRLLQMYDEKFEKITDEVSEDSKDSESESE